MYLSNIFIFPIPCISKVKHLSLLWHNSPPSMEQAKLSLEWQHCLQLKRLIHFYCLPLGLQRQPWPEKQEEEVLPGGSSTNSMSEGASGITFSYNICWALILEPSCGCGSDDDTDKELKETKILEKFLNNLGIKNKCKSRPKKSRDPGIENLDPARAW